MFAASCSLLNAPQERLPVRRDCDAGDCDAGAGACAHCDPLASCRGNDAGPVCVCPAGFADVDGDGTHCRAQPACEIDDDCDAGEVCDRRSAASACVCAAGYERSGERCENVDECAQGTHDCHERARCFDLDGGFGCACEAGYDDVGGDGRVCEDIDECAVPSPACGEHAVCTNGPGDFACACEPGYEGNARSGCADSDQCRHDLLECVAPATCSDLPGPDRCACPLYYTDANGDGSVCAEDRIVFSLFLDVDVAYVAGAPAMASGVAARDERIALAGPFEGELTAFCDQSLRSGPSLDLFVAVLDGEQRCIRARAFGSDENDWMTDVAVDAEGGVVMLTQLGGAFALDGGSAGVAGSPTCALIRLDPALSFDWALRVPCRDVPVGDIYVIPPWESDRLAIDGAGDIHFVSDYRAAASLGSFDLPAPAGSAIVLGTVSSTGVPRRAISYDSAGVHAFAVDASGRAYVYGSAGDGADLHTGGGPRPGPLRFLAALDADGTTRWVRTSRDDGARLDDYWDLAADESALRGLLYRYPVTGDAAVLVERTRPDGGLLSRSEALLGTQFTPKKIALDASGDAVVVGTFQGNAFMAGETFTTEDGLSHLFIARLDDGDSLLWGHAYAMEPIIHDLAVAPSGTIYLAGYGPYVDFGGGVTNAGAGPFFVVALRP